MEISYVEKSNEITGIISDGVKSGRISATFSNEVKNEMESKLNIDFKNEIKKCLDFELKNEIKGVDNEKL